MKPLVAKEIRLLLPAFVMALLLAIAPILLPVGTDANANAIVLSLFGFGVVMLALSSFGREFSLKTFPMILAQPVERRRVWWTKFAVLTGAMTTLFVAWSMANIPRVTDPYGFGWLETLAIGGMLVVVAVSGALWTTMLLRQVMAAFWFTILIPATVLMLIEITHGSARATFVSLGIYSVAGFALGWWQFNRAQETAWTGGVITFPGWGTADTAGRFYNRSCRPLSALFWKELQLQQVGLLGMAGLFVLHLGVVWLRKSGHFEIGDQTRAALEVFGGIWFIVPVVNASLSVAEERRLGTMQELLTLPVSSRVQFLVKFLLSLVISGLLSAALFWTAEGVGGVIGAPVDMVGLKAPFHLAALKELSIGFLALALIGFYASTLARGIVQALAAAFGTVIIVQLFGAWAMEPFDFGIQLWRGYLVYYIAYPTLIAIFVWLAWRNFRSVAENWRFWRGNILGVGGAMAFIVVATTAIYNRAWELVTPMEAHGPARLAGPNAIRLKTDGWLGLAAILPDGRLWVDRIIYNPGRELFPLWWDNKDGQMAEKNPTGFLVGRKWVSLSGNQILNGSNWMDAATTSHEIVGIRDDGTLWVSEKRHGGWDAEAPLPAAKDASYDLVRFGDEADWKSVAAHWSGVMLLKRDGTLWLWNPPYDNGTRKLLELRASKPQLLSDDSDWERILQGPREVYGWKKDGTAWAIRQGDNSFGSHHSDINGDIWITNRFGLYMERMPELDNARWQGFADYMSSHVGLREDGTLWAWNSGVVVSGGGKRAEVVGKRPLTQIGKDTDWVRVAGASGSLAAIKADGSLWAWYIDNWHGGWRGWNLAGQPLLPAVQPPVRQGGHRDWVAVGYSQDGIVSLAADGNLWFWCHSYDGINFPQPMMAPSRRPSKIENILADQK